MTDALRTAILDALMERWRERWEQAGPTTLAYKRKHLSSCLDMILPVAEPMIRKAALREAADVARAVGVAASGLAGLGGFYATGQVDAADDINSAIIALGEPK